MVAQQSRATRAPFTSEAVDRARELGLAGVVANGLAELADDQIVVGAWDEAEVGSRRGDPAG